MKSIVIALLSVGILTASPVISQELGSPNTERDFSRTDWPKEAICGGGKIVLSDPSSKVKPTWVQKDGTKTEVYSGKFPATAIAACGSGVVTIFGDGTMWARNDWAYYSPSCKSIGGGDNTVNVYNGNHVNLALYPHESGKGVIAAWRHPDGGNTSVYYSPDCYNLGGGLHSVKLQ